MFLSGAEMEILSRDWHCGQMETKFIWQWRNTHSGGNEFLWFLLVIEIFNSPSLLKDSFTGIIFWESNFISLRILSTSCHSLLDFKVLPKQFSINFMDISSQVTWQFAMEVNKILYSCFVLVDSVTIICSQRIFLGQICYGSFGLAGLGYPCLSQDWEILNSFLRLFPSVLLLEQPSCKYLLT